jgi:hypothetical protein
MYAYAMYNMLGNMHFRERKRVMHRRVKELFKSLYSRYMISANKHRIFDVRNKDRIDF